MAERWLLPLRKLFPHRRVDAGEACFCREMLYLPAYRNDYLVNAMPADPELLTTTEAAVVADVTVRDVNRLIDEHILPEQLYSVEGSRRVYAGACALMNFYVSTAESLTSHERSNAIRSLWADSKAKHAVWTIKNWRRSKPKWTVHHHFLTINFDKFVADTIERHHKLTEAQKIVVEDAGILDGTPVIKGTRVPVHDIAASAEAGLTIAQIKDAYPSLDKNLIELAILYAKAVPPRGRPRHIKPDVPAAAARKVVRRRTA
jgi:uncharacterized protein (DUF433 family)